MNQNIFDDLIVRRITQAHNMKFLALNYHRAEHERGHYETYFFWIPDDVEIIDLNQNAVLRLLRLNDFDMNRGEWLDVPYEVFPDGCAVYSKEELTTEPLPLPEEPEYDYDDDDVYD